MAGDIGEDHSPETHLIPLVMKYTDRRPGDPAVLVASADKAKKILGWRPQLADLRTIIESAWAWHKEHPDGFDDRHI